MACRDLPVCLGGWGRASPLGEPAGGQQEQGAGTAAESEASSVHASRLRVLSRESLLPILSWQTSEVGGACSPGAPAGKWSREPPQLVGLWQNFGF